MQAHVLAESLMSVCWVVPVDIETVRQAMRLSNSPTGTV